MYNYTSTFIFICISWLTYFILLYLLAVRLDEYIFAGYYENKAQPRDAQVSVTSHKLFAVIHHEHRPILSISRILVTGFRLERRFQLISIFQLRLRFQLNPNNTCDRPTHLLSHVSGVDLPCNNRTNKTYNKINNTCFLTYNQNIISYITVSTNRKVCVIFVSTCCYRRL